ncbi:MAG: DEAD/DEAH box helicase, partial [Candidatus Marinamargulisbacteria bacterium]
HFDHVVGDIQYQQLDGILTTPATQKKAKKHPGLITPILQFKTADTHQLSLQLKWQHPDKPSLTTALTSHLRGGIPYYYDRKKQTIMAIEQTDILNDLSQNDDVTIPVGVAIFMALNTSFDINLPKALAPTVTALKPQATSSLGHMARPLRPFQKDGLKWLLSLHNTPFNGILADDMGLGKTIQSIFLLKKLALSTPHITLIIMPKTLLFNWKKELTTFAPELSVLLYDGPKRRELIPQLMLHNVILASYSAIRLDVNHIKDRVFDYLILDEAQYIKNRTTNTFKAIKKLQSHHRLLLTGTPIENNIGDIWSLMDMANPHYFGPFKSFDTFYSQPQHQSILKAAIHPFMLRRRKRDVLTDLPAITTQELWASPSKDELSAYTRLVQKEWHAIESIVQKKGIEKSKVHIFALITKLRQWCAHPALIIPDHDPGPKWMVFFERLQEAINTDHKVVVFSQFIPMIQTIESALTDHGISFVSLTGQTSNREQVVETFNQDPTIRVGIFSLKAGGVGINLTSADYVFMYDPWWNPAVEQQAIDRVHRMGQDRPVMVFKCLVAGTIEERMITYQEKKRGLIESLVENNTLNDMNLNDIKALIGL